MTKKLYWVKAGITLADSDSPCTHESRFLTVRETVQLPLGSPPVEPVGPVAEQLFQPVPVGALRPRLSGRGLRQPGAADPCPQIIDHRHIHGHRERLDANPRDATSGHRASSGAWAWALRRRSALGDSR